MAVITRGGAGGGVRSVVARGLKVLAWLNWVIAVYGGTMLAGTFIGGWIASMAGFIPGVAPAALFVAVVVMAVDIFIDWIPNQGAIWTAIFIPSVARGAHGRLGDWVRQESQRLTHAVSPHVVEWMGPLPALTLALTAIVAAVLMSRRVVRKGGS